jgi:hypothetical protein
MEPPLDRMPANQKKPAKINNSGDAAGVMIGMK